MLIVRDSQVKKLFYKGQEIDKILDWRGNVVFEKESAPVMTNDIKFHTTSSVTNKAKFLVVYTDTTTSSINYLAKDTWYTSKIPTDKTVYSINTYSSIYVDEIIVSGKIQLSNNFFNYKPKTIRLLNCDSTSSTSLANLFSGSNNIETLEMKDLDVRNVTDMNNMFSECTSATTIDITNWDTSSLTQMKNMFLGCKNVTDLDLSNFNTSAVTNMYGAFDSCEKLASIKLNGWNTSKVTNINYMFYYCSSLTSLDLSSFDVSLVTSIRGIFHTCSSLTSLDISGWDLTNTTSTYNMFKYCNKLKTIRMIGCNQTTIDKIKKALTDAGILNNVTIVTE